MQRQDAEIQAQQLRIQEHVPEADRGMVVMLGRRRIGHDPRHQPDRRQRQQAGEDEDAGEADHGIQRRRRHQREGEHQADAGADQRHHLGAVLLARQVRRQRRHRCGNGAGALKRTAEDGPPDVRRGGGDEAAGGEDQQADDDDALSAVAVRGHAEGQLQGGLGQAVDA